MLSNPPPELVWLDGPEDPTFVILRSNDKSHYFYWPYELSTRILKANDVEPVKLCDGRLVLSRYHFYALTVWIDPQKQQLGGQSNPVAYMMRNFHTPQVVDGRHKNVKVISVSKEWNHALLEKITYLLFRRLFAHKLKLPFSGSNPRPYSSKYVSEVGKPMSPLWLFDSAYVKKFIHELIIVGNQLDIDKLMADIAASDARGRISLDGVIKFFDFL